MKNIKETLFKYYQKSKRTQQFTGRILVPVSILQKRLQESFYRPKKLRSFPRSLQTDGYTCGAHCVYVVLKWYKCARSLKQVTRELGTTKEGTDEKHIKKVLSNRGLNYEEFYYKNIATLKRAINQNHPIIVSVDYEDHWLVVYGYCDKDIWVIDPSIIRSPSCRQTNELFKSRWTGYGLIVSEPAA